MSELGPGLLIVAAVTMCSWVESAGKHAGSLAEPGIRDQFGELVTLDRG